MRNPSQITRNEAAVSPQNPQASAVAPPIQQPSIADTPLQAAADSPAAAEGRRTLSTAYVRVGADGYLTVELRSGRVIVLRNVVMRAKDYCGVQSDGGKASGKYCGGYADVASARPGGGPPPLVQPSNAGDVPRG